MKANLLIVSSLAALSIVALGGCNASVRNAKAPVTPAADGTVGAGQGQDPAAIPGKATVTGATTDGQTGTIGLTIQKPNDPAATDNIPVEVTKLDTDKPEAKVEEQAAAAAGFTVSDSTIEKDSDGENMLVQTLSRGEGDAKEVIRLEIKTRQLQFATVKAVGAKIETNAQGNIIQQKITIKENDKVTKETKLRVLSDLLPEENGQKQVLKLESTGVKDEAGCELFASKVPGKFSSLVLKECQLTKDDSKDGKMIRRNLINAELSFGTKASEEAEEVVEKVTLEIKVSESEVVAETSAAAEAPAPAPEAPATTEAPATAPEAPATTEVPATAPAAPTTQSLVEPA